MSLKIQWGKPDFGPEERKAINRVFDSSWLSQGPETEQFEKELQKYIGCKHVICTNNGTSAFIVALLSHYVKEAVVPAFAYPSILNIFRHLKFFHPYHSDISHLTLQMIPESWHKDFWHLPMSFAGIPLDEAKWKKYRLIEDGAESLGAKSRDKRTGNQGWTTVLSFSATKLLSTIEGGAICTNDYGIDERVRKIRHRSYLNFQTTDISSAIGRVQLKKLDKYLNHRQHIADHYTEELEGKVTFLDTPEHCQVRTNMIFPIFVDDPRLLSKRLSAHGVETRLGWAPILANRTAVWASEHILMLPIYNSMIEEETEYVIEWLKRSL